jgi:hypothetical protein
MRMLRWTNRNNNPGSLGLQCVGMRPVEIENDARDERAAIVLPAAHAPHAIGPDWDVPDVVADDPGEIEDNAVGIERRLHGGLDRGAQGNFHPKVGSLRYGSDTLHRRGAVRMLCRGAGHHQQ